MNVRKVFWQMSATLNASWKDRTGQDCPARFRFLISSKTRCRFQPGPNDYWV